MPNSYLDFTGIDEGNATCKYIRPSAQKILVDEGGKVNSEYVPLGYLMVFDPVFNGRNKEKGPKEFLVNFGLRNSFLWCGKCRAIMAVAVGVQDSGKGEIDNSKGGGDDLGGKYRLECRICGNESEDFPENLVKGTYEDRKQFVKFLGYSANHGVYELEISDPDAGQGDPIESDEDWYSNSWIQNHSSDFAVNQNRNAGTPG